VSTKVLPPLVRVGCRTLLSHFLNSLRLKVASRKGVPVVRLAGRS
jgi:hypothetical protein